MLKVLSGLYACVLCGVLAAVVHNARASPHFLATRDDPPTSATTIPDIMADRNLTVGPCTWIVNHKCPDEENIKIYLFTRRNPNDRQRIHVDETWEKSNLSTSFFNPADPVKIIIHGYNSDMFLSSLIEMKDGKSNWQCCAHASGNSEAVVLSVRPQSTFSAAATICSTLTGANWHRLRAI